METIAAAERNKITLEAEAEAEAIRMRGEAQAFAVEAKAAAEAEQMVSVTCWGYGICFLEWLKDIFATGADKLIFYWVLITTEILMIYI